MDVSNIIIVVILVAGFAAVLFFLKNQQKVDKGDNQSLLMLQNQLNDLARTLDSKIGESSKQMQEHLRYSSSETVKIVRDVTEKLVKLDETNKQVVNFADQLKNLQDILKNPKQRGILGEYYLETVLSNVLPEGQFQTQYPFRDGVIVDAVVFITNNNQKQIIPIDSKFSLENYNRFLEAKEPSDKKKYETAFVTDIKNRIDETSKYIKPEEDTVDFAFMFIPSEAIYYDILVNKVGSLSDENKNLIDYAWAKKVVIVSPTSFLAYLQTMLQGLKNQKISEKAKDIIKQVVNLNKHLSAHNDYLHKLGKNLGTTVSMYNHAHKEFVKVDKDVLKISGEKIGVEPEMLEAPDNDIEI
ncbi:MAG: DNA recombination protein RmuC [Candidatus Woesebacteria bacterium]|nr:DNA recombination protein RmuC [Candidatus Woesebacteria bacterium]